MLSQICVSWNVIPDFPVTVAIIITSTTISLRDQALDSTCIPQLQRGERENRN